MALERVTIRFRKRKREIALAQYLEQMETGERSDWVRDSALSRFEMESKVATTQHTEEEKQTPIHSDGAYQTYSPHSHEQQTDVQPKRFGNLLNNL